MSEFGDGSDHHLYLRSERVERRICERGVPRHARVVDEDIDVDAEGFRFLEDGPGRGTIGEIRGYDVASHIVLGRQLVGQRDESVLASRDENEVVPLGREVSGKSRAYAR